VSDAQAKVLADRVDETCASPSVGDSRNFVDHSLRCEARCRVPTSRQGPQDGPMDKGRPRP